MQISVGVAEVGYWGVGVGGAERTWLSWRCWREEEGPWRRRGRSRRKGEVVGGASGAACVVASCDGLGWWQCVRTPAPTLASLDSGFGGVYEHGYGFVRQVVLGEGVMIDCSLARLGEQEPRTQFTKPEALASVKCTGGDTLFTFSDHTCGERD